MSEALFMLGIGFLGGSLGGFVAGSMVFARVSRRCTALEWAVGDLQNRASTFKGREMADKRWKKAESFEAEMAQALHNVDPPRKRYDNDPLG